MSIREVFRIRSHGGGTRWNPAAVLSLAAVFVSAPGALASNYLVIIADDLGVDKVNAYAGDYPGYAAATAYLPRTDTIDSLAAAGLRFKRAWASPLCSPTRASFQTGQQPFRTGVGYPLSPGQAGLDTTAFTMLADSFATLGGYATGSFGKWHIGEEDAGGNVGVPTTSPFYDAPHPALAGWDRFFGTLDGDINDYWNWERVGWLGGSGIGYTGTETTHATARTAAVALDWINSRTTSWLAVVAFHAPHSRTATNNWSYADADPTRVRSASLACLATSSCADEDRAVYQGLVEQMDLEIESLLNGMDPAVLDDTIVVFFGDNGTPSQVEEGSFDVTPARGKGTTYENGVRVPLIVADGGTWRTGAAGAITSPNRTVDAGVHVLDLYQTLHNHALAVSVAFVDSSSFVDCFTRTGRYCGFPSRRYGYAESYRTTPNLSADVAVHYGYDKMVAWYDPAQGCMQAEYYNTRSDRLETRPKSWATRRRGTRLQDHFASLHASDPTSWAIDPATGAPFTFCP